MQARADVPVQDGSAKADPHGEGEPQQERRQHRQEVGRPQDVEQPLEPVAAARRVDAIRHDTTAAAGMRSTTRSLPDTATAPT